MNHFNNNTDQKIKDMIQDHEFDFMESAWEDMELILEQGSHKGDNEEDAKPGSGNSLWLYSSITIGLIMLSLAFIYPSTARQIFEAGQLNFENIFQFNKEEIKEVKEIKSEPFKEKASDTPQAFVPQNIDTDLKEIKSEIKKPTLRPIAKNLTSQLNITTIANVDAKDLIKLKTINTSISTKKKKKKKMDIEVYAGTSIAPSNGKISSKGTINPYIGVAATFPINNRLSLQTGVEIKKMNVNNLIENTSKNNTALAIATPIVAKYKLTKKNSLTAGIKPAYIRQSSNKISGIDLGLSVGIEHQINDQLSVDLKYNQTVMDTTNNEYFNPDLQSNSDIALSMRYKF